MILNYQLMYDIRESLLLQLEKYLSPCCKIEIEVDWDAGDFDLFIGQTGYKPSSEIVTKTFLTNDFSIIRSTDSDLKTKIEIVATNPNDSRHITIHRIIRTSGEAVSGAMITRTLQKLGLYQVGY